MPPATAYDVFVSYNRKDALEVETLVAHLHAEAGFSVWLDRARLTPGASWRDEIETAMNSTAAVVLVWGKDGLGPVQLQERDLAYAIRDEQPNLRVLNVLLPGSPTPKGSWANIDTWIAFNGGLDDPEALANLTAAIKGEAPPTPLDSDLPDSPAPYPGLRAYGTQGAEFFHGRNSVISEMIERLSYHPFLALIGPSGSGKTSVVQAGLLARLQAGAVPDSASWPGIVIRPGIHPVRSLAIGLAQLYDDKDPLAAADEIHAKLQDSAGEIQGIVQSLRGARSAVVLIVDRLEELFTLCTEDAERRGFVNALMLALQEPGGHVWVVTTMRADFYGHLGPYADIANEIVEHQIYLKPLAAGELPEVIETPAAQVGAIFEKGLAALIARDALVRGEVALSLLQQALDLLWQHRRGRWLTWDTYEQIGGVEGALSFHAERTIQALDEGARNVAKRLLTHLVWLDESGGTISSRRVDKVDLVERDDRSDDAEKTLQCLVDARLVVLRGMGEEATAELAHDSLPLNWARLGSWVQEDREFLLWKQRLQTAIDEWERSDRDAGALLRGNSLIETERWAQERESDLSANEQEYIQQSFEQRAREQQKQAEDRRARERLRRRATVTVAVAAVVGLVLASLAGFQWTRADQQRVIAERERDRALVTESRRLADLSLEQSALGDTATAIRLALHALPANSAHPDRPYVAQAEAALYAALSIPRSKLDLRKHGGPVRAIAFSPDGSRLATASSDMTALLWDIESGNPIATLEGHEGALSSVDFSPDGSIVVTGGSDGTARIWDAGSGHQRALLAGHEAPVVAVRFDASGRRIATASRDGTGRVWDSASGAVLAILKGHAGVVEDIRFSPDSATILTVSSDSTGRLWNAADGAPLQVLRGHEDAVRTGDFQPSEARRIVTGSNDGTARLWDAASGEAVMVFAGHRGPVSRVAFDREGSALLTASEDTTVRVWDIRLGDQRHVLRGHRGWVEDIAVSPDGRQAATASSDGTARLWDLLDGTESAVLRHRDTAMNSVRFSPDGESLATASNDGSAQLWNTQRGGQAAALQRHEGPVRFVAFSSDGRYLVSASGDRTARIWDAGDGHQVARLEGHQDVVWKAVFDHGGEHVATASADGMARIFAARGGKAVSSLSGHSAAITDLVYSADSRLLATASEDREARLWDAASGREMAVFRGHQDWINSIVLNATATQALTASSDGTARIWDAANGLALAVLDGHLGPVRRAIFAGAGQSLAITASDDGTARIWRLPEATNSVVLEGHAGPVTSLAVSADHRLLATISDDATARVWSLPDGRPIAVLQGHLGPLTDVHFSPVQNSRLATTSEDGMARIWEAGGGTAIAVFQASPGAIWHAAFDVDGARLITAANDGSIRFFDIFPSTQAIVEYARNTGANELTEEEKAELFVTAASEGEASEGSLQKTDRRVR